MRWLWVLLLPVAAEAAMAADGAFTGRPVADVIDEYRAAGYAFAYSTNLVPDALVVLAEPDADAPVDIVRQILAPHGLTLRLESGIYLVVRDPAPATRAAPAPETASTPLSIEEIAVSASRYEIASEAATSRYSLDERTIQNNPDLGDDPLRVVQRLPGAAASGASARTHFRGGEDGEIGIVLNGQRLLDPFHVRDFQSLFSAIDSRAIAGVEVYTGGFPVHYGDRMSGMILMESVEAPQEPHNEIGVSVYNTSLLTAGGGENRHWLLSARRGNLDLVIDPRFGSPKYADVFGRFGFELSPTTSVALNALYADDRVVVITESDPEDLQRVSSDTQNLQVWLEVDNRWSDALTSRTVFSVVAFENLREGTSAEEEYLVGWAYDARDASQVGFRQDFRYASSAVHRLEWGLEVRRSDATYDYESHADYFGLAALYAGQPETLDRAVAAAPEGASYALYFADRRMFRDSTVLEWGLRWDDQSYTGGTSDAQLSPRVSILHTFGDGTDLRLSWGRYHQAQDIHELQVEDGIAEFFPAQRADHLIAGATQRFGERHALRIEAFYKDMDDVRPRFENLFDPLSVIPEIQPDRVRLDPAGATARGVEISFGSEGRHADWWVAYTWSEVVDRIEGRDERRSWNQEHSLQAGIDWSNAEWDVSLAAGFHSGWPQTELALLETGTDPDGEPEYVALPGSRNADDYPAFASLDVRIARTWALRRGSLMAFLEVTNLTNRRNECCLDWDLDEDDETGEAFLERGVDYWLPLLPAVGVRWEF
ncbi:MAG TPA: TonB-dependent receptor [Woeseiaceae bacterium]|nr:TonB-dependent receptor [Woeseiaceae bacterium]